MQSCCLHHEKEGAAVIDPALIALGAAQVTAQAAGAPRLFLESHHSTLTSSVSSSSGQHVSSCPEASAACALQTAPAHRPEAPRTLPATPQTVLRSSSVAFLVKKTPIQSDMSIPAPIMNIPPLLVVPKHLLTRKPATAAEAELQNSLQMAVNVYNAQTASLSEAHAHLVLQDTYVARCRAQIAEAEQKRKSSATRNARLLGDGLPQLLTSNELLHGLMLQVKHKLRRRHRTSYGQLQAALAHCYG
ncbi:hypothetical protein BKA62DRAFT_679211 [Auriculariales sp. MPI-PUGE-AT-0066]|nr:hypothetical protein BKA62DRAFT_679211 [Auriculariales sp. MPI-PUGE-AT-0066]